MNIIVIEQKSRIAWTYFNIIFLSGCVLKCTGSESFCSEYSCKSTLDALVEDTTALQLKIVK